MLHLFEKFSLNQIGIDLERIFDLLGQSKVSSNLSNLISKKTISSLSLIFDYLKQILLNYVESSIMFFSLNFLLIS